MHWKIQNCFKQQWLSFDFRLLFTPLVSSNFSLSKLTFSSLRPIYVTLDDFSFIAPKHFIFIWLSNLSTLSVPDEGYSRNASCPLNLISTLLLRKPGKCNVLYNLINNINDNLSTNLLTVINCMCALLV